MTDISRNELVEIGYESIIKKITGSILFGEPIDRSKMKEVVLAAYYVGKKEEIDSRLMMDTFE